MKALIKILGIGMFSIIFSKVIAQDPCLRSRAEKVMAVNNVSAQLYTHGNLFEDAHYITPKERGVSAIYNAGIWLFGKDEAENRIASAVFYSSSGFDFFAGPLDKDGKTSKNNCSSWDQIFTVTSIEIEEFFEIYNISISNNIPLQCGDIPIGLLKWPAKGNPFFMDYFGWELPNDNLASFYDRNGDGLYNPCEGDYPYIDDKCEEAMGYHNNEKIPAEINYFVFNDAGGLHTFSGPGGFGMEIHVHAYAYATDDELNDMTFYNYRMVNKSNKNYHDFRFDLAVDPDLGCHLDDFIGCDTVRGMAYIYNSKDFDGFENDNSCMGTPIYGNEIPMIGLDFVKGPKISKSFLKDESGDIVYDENGHKILIDNRGKCNLTDTLISGQMTSFKYFVANMERSSDNYDFPSDPDDTLGISMCTKIDTTYDWRFTMSMGPLCFAPSESHSLTLAIFTAHNVPYPCPSLEPLRKVNDVAQDIFKDCSNIVNAKNVSDASFNIRLFPNPSYLNHGVTIAGLPQKAVIEIFDFMGHQYFRVDTVKNLEYFEIPSAIHFHSGMYLVKVTDAITGHSKTVKWLVR